MGHFYLKLYTKRVFTFFVCPKSVLALFSGSDLKIF